MPIIHELSSHLADLIAAGEVVERPASVVKELMENAIDAGATRITVEIENGGISYLRIADDGCGMAKEDAPIAFLRHATSKLRTEQDLNAIGTLGFRGEALAAIASVTHIDLFTRQEGQLSGIHLHLDAGKLTVSEEAGCPEGTTIITRDLFFNTPARMKFLKKDFTEAGYVLSAVQHAAMSHPEIAFTLIRDGKQVFSTDGRGKLIAPVFAVFGKEIVDNLLPVPKTEVNGITVTGYIIKPHAGRANRSMQHFFVNGRYVKNRVMQAAMEEAYRNAIITGKYPSGVLLLEMSLSAVDVNVHPAKIEVKFSQEKQVFEAVYAACKNALAAGDNIPQITAKTAGTPREDHLTDRQQRFAIPATPHEPQIKQTPVKAPPLEEFYVAVPPKADLHRGIAASPLPPITGGAQPPQHFKSQPPLSKPMSAPASDRAPIVVEQNMELPPDMHSLDDSLRVIGECFQTYILAEDADGLILIDKHAAHERILFNKLRQQTDMPQQTLLVPAVVELNGEEAAAVQEHLSEVQAAGFAIEPFGLNSFSVRNAPAFLDAADVPSVIQEIAEKLQSGRSAVSDRLDDLIHTVACKAAIKAGHGTTLTELTDLCRRVLYDDTVRSCPHGRPVTVRLTKYELDKMFKRVNQ